MPILLHGNLREEAIKALPIESYPTKSAWNHLSLKDHRGIALPLISITSKNSSGCGEFLDLIPLIEWVKKSGLDLLQLLPIGDTGGVKSPYSPISAHALNPIYLSLASLPYLDEAPSYLIESLEKLKKNNLSKRVDYIKVLREKEEWLKKYLALFEKKLKKHPEYILFCQKEGNWLDDYACFKVLRQKYGPVIKNWPERLKAVSSEDKERLYGKYKALMSQQKLIQYLCFDQMHFVHLFADHHTVFLMGDMPYMLSRDSVEVWLHPSIFQLDMNLGTAPGYTTKKGEDWGLPPYDWNHIEANHFKYFKGRLLSLSHYFDLYRIDHCQGFFNQFIIPKGRPPSAGSNEITDKQSMLEAGKRRLTALANLAPMLPIAEDLRFDASQKKIIEALGIPGVNIFVWMNRALPLSNLSIFGKDFNLMTITKLSNHDLPPIRTWWKDNPPLARALASKMDWKYHVELNSQEQLQLLWWQMHSSSLLHIEFLQDILPPNIGGNSSDLRINFPGTNNERDWSYRFPLTIEELVSSKIVEDMIGGMLNSQGTSSIKKLAPLE